MTIEAPPSGSPPRRRATATAVAVAWLATFVLGARELAGWISFCRPEGTDTAARLLPLDASVAAADPERGPGAGLARRPRDRLLLQDVAEARFESDEPEARRLMVVAARVAPYAGLQAAENAERLLAIATERARATVEAREVVRRLEGARVPQAGLGDARLEAARRLANARATLATILALDAEIAKGARGRRVLDATAAEARRLLDDLGDAP